ncbi:MAG: hypothetical protein JWO24_4162 [Rhodospirillales bacterium]|nr:hypothetical protein [Rhodospirillales bacterium]
MRPVPLPGVWAADMRFDFLAGAISIDEMRYVAVAAVRGPAPDLRTGELMTAPQLCELAPLTPDSVRALSDDEVLMLLEEHSLQVIAGTTEKLAPPGWLTIMPLVMGKFRSRAAAGLTEAKVSDEARELHRWVEAAAPHHHAPSRVGN